MTQFRFVSRFTLVCLAVIVIAGCGTLFAADSASPARPGVPHIFVAEKTKDDATAGGRDLDLVGVGAHTEMLADVVQGCERTFGCGTQRTMQCLL